MLSHHDLAVIAGAAYRGPWSGRVALDCDYDLLPRGDDELVVALPGTNPADALDWIRDFSAWPGAFPVIGLCHAGFGGGATALAANILPTIAGDKRLKTVTGHSLGGAMALGLGALLIAAGHRVRVVSFGAPRVAFCMNLALGRRLRRAEGLAEYRRAGDPVPDLPPSSLFKPETAGVSLGVAIGDPIANHAIARYAADLAALGL